MAWQTRATDAGRVRYRSSEDRLERSAVAAYASSRNVAVQRVMPARQRSPGYSEELREEWPRLRKFNRRNRRYVNQYDEEQVPKVVQKNASSNKTDT